eukprot:XP_014780111.1 PREDICTED: carnosine N-methyltransferase-like [Octopus bimaculoides]
MTPPMEHREAEKKQKKHNKNPVQEESNGSCKRGDCTSVEHVMLYSLNRIRNTERYYDELPDHHRSIIPNFRDHLGKVRNCIETNFHLIKLIIQNTEHMFENKNHGPVENKEISVLQGEEGLRKHPPTSYDMDRVKTTLKQFVRDWSESGRSERSACYDPVIKEIRRRFPPQIDPSTVFVLVPGAGLGRLAYELAKLGYSCQGNEWSLFMLFASNFVLNKCREANAHKLYPWIHQWINNKTSADQIEPVSFPDVNPADLPANSNFSMAAGDFLEVYTEPNSWDCVATVFFIDTAHNIISYVETIWRILKPGGFWVNLVLHERPYEELYAVLGIALVVIEAHTASFCNTGGSSSGNI